MSSHRAIVSIFCAITLQVISSPGFSQPHSDYSFDPSLTLSPSVHALSSGSLIIDLNAPNHPLPELIILNITVSDINCSSEKCFAHITYDGNEIWRKQIFSKSLREVFTTSLVMRSPGHHSVDISTSDNAKWNIEHISIDKKELPRQTHGISYSPFRACQSPGGIEPTMSEVD